MATSPRAARALLLSFAFACRDATAPVRDEPAGTFDLVFDGEDALGRRLLFRSALDDAAPRLIGDGIEGMRPAPSPDGRRIAFYTPETYAQRAQLRVYDVATRGAEWLEGTDASERELTWSPDGRRAAFVSKRDDWLAGDIFVADVDGNRLANPRNLTPRTDASPEIEPQYTPAWSPDGTRIAFTSYRSGGPAIWVMDADGGNAHSLTSSGEYIDALPTWAPNGREIAFQRNGPSGTRVGIVSTDDKSLRFIPLDEAAAPAWSPDGRHLAVVSTVDGDRDVIVITPNGTVVRRIRRPGTDFNPAWARRVM
jgi:Tol biopolymer transport system component